MDRYAVMGNPVAHSRSPEIHRRFAEQTGQALVYEAILVPRDGFADAVHAFREAGGRGLNVTVPFKQEAYALSARRTARAERAGAVNTLSFGAEDSLSGDNTDGAGLVRDLTLNHGIELEDSAILLLGAGGAVRGVLGPLLEAGPLRTVLANRTPDKAVSLARQFATLGNVEGTGLDGLDGRRFDLVINGTSASLAGQLPTLPDDLLRSGAVCYDMVYADEPTPFMRWAREHGARLAVDGLGMLVEQAAESFYIWRAVRPRTAPVIEALRRPAGA
ncbi:MAG TPA: shikimate dehydrogenase [Gammaproteobacteria bacterium]|nr:shikimate dehydrogenase [Gammaproteobacteria bacterium]